MAAASSIPQTQKLKLGEGHRATRFANPAASASADVGHILNLLTPCSPPPEVLQLSTGTPFGMTRTSPEASGKLPPPPLLPLTAELRERLPSPSSPTPAKNSAEAVGRLPSPASEPRRPPSCPLSSAAVAELTGGRRSGWPRTSKPVAASCSAGENAGKRARGSLRSAATVVDGGEAERCETESTAMRRRLSGRWAPESIER